MDTNDVCNDCESEMENELTADDVIHVMMLDLIEIYISMWNNKWWFFFRNSRPMFVFYFPLKITMIASSASPINYIIYFQSPYCIRFWLTWSSDMSKPRNNPK